MHGLKRRHRVNPIQEYISQQKREFEEQFPACYDSTDLCNKDELESFLTYHSLLVVHLARRTQTATDTSHFLHGADL
jgi:hypothetical protein